MTSAEERGGPYALRLNIDYPGQLDRVSTAFRILWLIPIAILAATLGATFSPGPADAAVGGGLLAGAPGLMILFRRKYPRWWFEWNVELLRFTNRIGAYAALMTDQYPATDEEQSVHLEIDYPDVEADLNRWLPLVKWLLAIPHYIVLFFLFIAEFVVVVIVWFAILFTGRYPRTLFNFMVGVARWQNRVLAYAFLMVTDEYPPLTLEE